METIEIFFEKHTHKWYMVIVNDEDEETEDIAILSEKMARFLIKKCEMAELAEHQFGIILK